MRHAMIFGFDITRGDDGQHFATAVYSDGTREIVDLTDAEAKTLETVTRINFATLIGKERA
jgi:hypothetical protein